MLRFGSLLGAKRATTLGQSQRLNRQMTAVALTSPFEASTASTAVSLIEAKNLAQSYWNRFVATLRLPYTVLATQGAQLESAILKASDGAPSSYSPGVLISSTRKVGALREYIYRNVYPNFVGGEKRWVFRLAAANAFTFLLWQTYGNFPSGREAMWENFMVSIKSVRSGRLWVMATSSVSSENLISLSLNTTAILSFGTPALAAVGSLPFLALYFGSAFVGSCLHMEYFAFPTQTTTPTANQLWYSDHASYHSASAAASGLAGFQLGSWPTRRFPIGPLTVQAWIPAVALLAVQIVHADNTRQPWYGNLGGLLLGVAFGFLSRGRVRI